MQYKTKITDFNSHVLSDQHSNATVFYLLHDDQFERCLLLSSLFGPIFSSLAF